jgi:hypothetical protein
LIRIHRGKRFARNDALASDGFAQRRFAYLGKSSHRSRTVARYQQALALGRFLRSHDAWLLQRCLRVK